MPQTRARLGVGGGGGSSCTLPTDVGRAVLPAPVEEAAAVEADGEEAATVLLAAAEVTAAVREEAVVDERGVSGRGHTSSCTSSGQYSLIWE